MILKGKINLDFAFDILYISNTLQYKEATRVHIKKHLGFSGLRKILSKRFLQANDSRKEGRSKYRMHDFFMTGFAMMFFQDPSLLAFQRRLQKAYNMNNLNTMFDIHDIPKDTQLRDVLDQASTGELEAVFLDYLHQLQRGKHLELYRFLNDSYLVPLDGSEYFSSKKLSCPGCLKKQKAKGIRYHHQILQAVIVHPDMKQVLPLAPEAIQNKDGSKKQDCEINAGKRIISRIRDNHPKLKMIITGDGLYSKQPFIDVLKKNAMSYILVAKPTDHKILFEWVDELTGLGDGSQFEVKPEKGVTHWYQWINEVPLNGTKGADDVNFFEFKIIKDNKVTYKNSWVTDIHIDKSNIKDLVRGARARWKIENETFNTLKNQGYHIEHNYGHGQKNLSMIFFMLNLLAFYTHQVLELTDLLYQRCRQEFTSRKEFWNQIRCTFRFMVFKDWETMLEQIIGPPDFMPP